MAIYCVLTARYTICEVFYDILTFPPPPPPPCFSLVYDVFFESFDFLVFCDLAWSMHIVVML